MSQVLKSLLVVFAVLTVSANTEAQARSCQLVYQLAEELRCSLGGQTLPSATPADPEFLVTASYGPTQCKTGDVLKLAIKELRDECNNWLKERKADLQGKYQTGTCQEDCRDCGTSLRNCTVRGTVHYSK